MINNSFVSISDYDLQCLNGGVNGGLIFTGIICIAGGVITVMSAPFIVAGALTVAGGCAIVAFAGGAISFIAGCCY